MVGRSGLIYLRDRQRGRVASGSVIHCGTGVDDINNALCKAMQADFRQSIKNVKNPYEGENTSSGIVSIIKQHLQDGINIKKKFYDLDMG